MENLMSSPVIVNHKNGVDEETGKPWNLLFVEQEGLIPTKDGSFREGVLKCTIFADEKWSVEKCQSKIGKVYPGLNIVRIECEPYTYMGAEYTHTWVLQRA